jgi:hypothetical protein
MEDQTRNLDPHRPAKCAMWLYSDRYSKLGIGSMNFWDRLTDSEKSICTRMAEDIVCTRPKSDDED